MRITVYGREQICASCAGAPGSRDTYEWLQAAVGRKYGISPFSYTYINMDEFQSDEKHQRTVSHLRDQKLFYPVVMLDDEVIAEGIPHLTAIFQAIESKGLKPKP